MLFGRRVMVFPAFNTRHEGARGQIRYKPDFRQDKRLYHQVFLPDLYYTYPP